MIIEDFDRRMMARMEVALNKVCERLPGGGNHNLRKRVVQSIIRCVKTGNNSLDALTEAGERVLAQLQKSSKGSVKAEAQKFGTIGRALHGRPAGGSGAVAEQPMPASSPSEIE